MKWIVKIYKQSQIKSDVIRSWLWKVYESTEKICIMGREGNEKTDRFEVDWDYRVEMRVQKEVERFLLNLIKNSVT